MKQDIILILSTPREIVIYKTPQQKSWAQCNTPHPKGSTTQPSLTMLAPSPRVRVIVSFGPPLVTHVWEPAAIKVSGEPMQEEKEDAINDPLTGKLI